MGVPLTPIVVRKLVDLAELRGKPLAVDGNGELYQFLALIRQRDGTPLQDSKGRISSHLVGLFYRTTRLISDFGLDLVFVFDGKPPSRKSREIARRREVKIRYDREAAEARAAGELARAYSKSTMTSRLGPEMVREAKELLELLGVPVLQAPGEAEAQAAFLARQGAVWAAASKDYDCLLFGTPRLVRFLTLSGKEFLPSKGVFRPLRPELIDASAMSSELGISREQLIDLAILVGTDFNEGVRGIGPKKALTLVKQCGAIEGMPEAIREKVPDYQDVRRIYLEPDVTGEYALERAEPDERGLVQFLCVERDFSRDRVESALKRMRAGR